MKTSTFFLLMIYFLIQFSAAQPVAQNLYNHNPYGFTENKGQIRDQNGDVRNDVRFIFSDGCFKIILRDNGFSYEWSKAVPSISNGAESGQLDQDDDEEMNEIPENINANRIDITLNNCNKGILISGSDPLSFYTNYFNGYTGPKGIRRVHCFNEVTYQNIYNGIDLVFSLIKNGAGPIRPEYKFIIHEGGNSNKISLSYSGEKLFSLNKDGSLQSNADLGFVKESNPVIQSTDGGFIETGKFIVKGSNVSFAPIKSTLAQEFIIDPTIEWGSYYGGNGRDVPDELAYDGKQHIYLTGRTQSTDMIATKGTYQTSYAGRDDVPLIKIDEQDNVVWGTYYGGKNNDVSWAITTDSTGNIFLGGRTVSASGIATKDAVIDTVSGGYFDVFIAKFSPEGDLLYGTYMGGDLKDEVQGMATDIEGNLYVSGYTESLYGIATPGAFKTTGDTTGEIFLMKWNNKMKLLWSTYYGGEGRDRGHGVNVDKFGQVYQTGTADSKQNIATPGSFQPTKGGALDGFLIRWTTGGQPVWSTYYGGEADEHCRDVKSDDDGNAYFVCQTKSTSNIATPGTFKDSFIGEEDGDKDAAIVKFDSSGKRIWGTYFGGNFIEMPRSLRVPPTGAPVYISGLTKSNSGLATDEAYNVDLGGHNDAFFAVINQDASQLMYSTYYGGKGTESINSGGWYGPSMELDENENVFLSSATKSPDSIATPGAYRDTILTTNEFDFFIAKFNNSCSDPWENNYNFTHAPKIPLDPLTQTAKLHGQIITGSDKDYFKFELDKKFSSLTVSLFDLPFNGDLFLYDEDKNQLATSQLPQHSNESITITNATKGTYYVLVKDHDTAGINNAECYQLAISVSDASPKLMLDAEEANFTLSPNPAHEFTTLHFQCKHAETYNIEIINATGIPVQSKKAEMKEGLNTVKITLTSLASGIYHLKISGKGEQWLQELVIQ
ncbi:MAG: SBBP repeat-containing protein [Chitinophagales bacterium]|nr:SBBP repeat-containing protein [Chitinophagales bacterium]